MAKLKKVKRKIVVKKKVVTRKKKVVKTKEPEYMVQIGDPENLRKDVLESLREIIIYMQGYENFKKVQKAKVEIFNKLKTDSKEINSLINQLRQYLPRGHLKPIDYNKKVKVAAPEQQPNPEVENQESLPQEQPAAPAEVPQEQPVAPTATPASSVPTSGLDELESQLKEIEDQLRGMG